MSRNPIKMIVPVFFLTTFAIQAEVQCKKVPSLFECKKPSELESKKSDLTWAFWADFIYWQPKQTFMDIALAAPFAMANDLLGISYQNGQIIEMNSNFKPGFKLGAGTTFLSNKMEVLADYTFLKANSSASATADPEGFLYTRWISSNLISDNATLNLSTHWHLDINVLNVEIGRDIHVHSFHLTPHAGLATAWIDQKLTGQFALMSPFCLINVSDSSRSWAIGPRFGIQGRWNIIPEFGIVANVATDILYTYYNLNLNQYSPDDSTVFLTSNNHINAIRPELEIYIGLQTGMRNFTFEAGYDFQVWWSQNMMRWYNDYTYISTPQGDLYFQGLRLTLRTDF